MKHKIQILVLVDAEEHELDDVCEDLRDGIENHVAVGYDQNQVDVLEVEVSESVEVP